MTVPFMYCDSDHIHPLITLSHPPSSLTVLVPASPPFACLSFCVAEYNQANLQEYVRDYLWDHE